MSSPGNSHTDPQDQGWNLLEPCSLFEFDKIWLTWKWPKLKQDSFKVRLVSFLYIVGGMSGRGKPTLFSKCLSAYVFRLRNHLQMRKLRLREGLRTYVCKAVTQIPVSFLLLWWLILYQLGCAMAFNCLEKQVYPLLWRYIKDVVNI
jgi:hypothetical protein